ncbi:MULTISPECIES: hypothetical protein [unclassified Sporosarcina]|uniref:hypothetical protein n=1 Tax=unclassified Sporosarcina TaxID=2647733 RepID=UPI000C170508|nr:MULTISPECIES: hypothetical protein [unclassified Sporosarcina]PID19358.1 hypothetical protein CSV62_02315 [Sporosarcina sp. P35]
MKTLQTELMRSGLADPVVVKKKETQKTQPIFTRRELEELMGTRRDTYKRVNGAVRRK